MRPLASGDTLCLRTPATFVANLERGTLEFHVPGADSIVVSMNRTPWLFTSYDSVSGRRLTARLVDGRVRVDPR